MHFFLLKVKMLLCCSTLPVMLSVHPAAASDGETCSQAQRFDNRNDGSRAKMNLRGCASISDGNAKLTLYADAFVAGVGNPFWGDEEGNAVLRYGYKLQKMQSGSWANVSSENIGSAAFAGKSARSEGWEMNVSPGSYRFKFDGNKTGGYWCAKASDGAYVREVHCSASAGISSLYVYDVIPFSGFVEFAV